jgi:SAM-dependent methyltransferase
MNIEFRSFKDRQDYTRYVCSSCEVISKDDYIRFLCKDREVLDVGCVQHDWERSLSLRDSWLFAQIQQVASSVCGIDILGEAAQKLSAYGFNIIEGNAEKFDLGRTFDVIVCGDIIEHLSNIGFFFESISRHLREDSLCVVTTPNPFNIEQLMSAIFHNRINVNMEHTVWLDPQVMYEAVSRSPMRIIAFNWIQTRFTFPIKRRFYGRYINAFSNYIMKKHPICGRDFAVVLKRK